MKTTRLSILCLALAAVPLAFAHPGGLGAAKPWCESAADRSVHDYGAPSTGFLVFLGSDGSIPPCPQADGTWDAHFEFAAGGAWLAACGSACGDTGLGLGSEACFGAPADHAPRTPIRVVDAALTAAGQPVRFWVYVETGTDCGDFEADVGVACVDVCTPPWPPGPDGVYTIYVEGTTGHVEN